MINNDYNRSAEFGKICVYLIPTFSSSCIPQMVDPPGDVTFCYQGGYRKKNKDFRSCFTLCFINEKNNTRLALLYQNNSD